MKDTQTSDATAEVFLVSDYAADRPCPSASVIEIKRSVRKNGLSDSVAELKPVPSSYGADEILWLKSTKRTGRRWMLTRTAARVLPGITSNSRQYESQN